MQNVVLWSLLCFNCKCNALYIFVYMTILRRDEWQASHDEYVSLPLFNVSLGKLQPSWDRTTTPWSAIIESILYVLNDLSKLFRTYLFFILDVFVTKLINRNADVYKNFHFKITSVV